MDETPTAAAEPKTTGQPTETRATIESIHRLMQELAETREKVRGLRDQLTDIMESNEEYRKVADEIKELTKKRAEAKRALADDHDYQVLSADLDDYRLKIRDLSDILSQHLVLYYNQTHQTKIVDQGGETRSVILTAKVGKTEA